MKYLYLAFMIAFMFLSGCSDIQLDTKNTQVLAAPPQHPVDPNASDKWSELKENFSPTIGWKMKID